ncbi:unnamed protein product [Rotaria sordida]|uniref:SH3 domain-containing protein n=1 Tax=Rotaria sordida TaxID=392033 RepID=A0A814MPE1_9BILA|nr:unnamed protein product [Rotaria sordida]CAF3784525.1 unnamed protein product [Rotaria sordida]
MALRKRTRFILVQSTSNANVNEDNMEPYHISIFRRSTSMPPLPKLSSSKKINFSQREQQQHQQSIVVSKYQRHEKDETLTNKFYKLNIHTMKKKSARISMRLSNAFGLSVHTIDEQFNFQEQRFRAIEKFSKLFLRNIYSCIEALRESFITQVDVAEDFEELLIDKIPDLAQQFLRLKRSLLEHTFTEFCNHIELYVFQPINTLIQLFTRPTNLISKRHKKLLDYDSAQSAYEKVKDQQLKQAKQTLNLSKQTYELLNNQLLEELPILYEYSCQILSICLKEFLHGHLYLMQQMRINIQIVLNQIIPLINFQQLNWQEIVNRFIVKNNTATEGLNQLIITSKNFSERIKNLSTIQLSSIMSNLYNSDKDTYIQTDEIRNLLKNNYPEQDLFIVIQDYTSNSYNNQLTNSKSDFSVRNGDLVIILNQHDKNNINSNCFVDNGVTRGYLPRSILIPLLSNNQSEVFSSIPICHDISVFSQVSLPLSHVNSRLNNEQPRKILTEPEICLINSSHNLENENEPIYLNQLNYQLSTIEIDETHQYASIDFDDSIIPISNEQERIYIALYDFDCTIDGVLCLHIGEQLKVLQYSDDDQNKEWWYVEKINDTRQRGYVPANYIQAV